MNKANILIIGVIYNTHQEALRYLESIEIPEDIDFTLVLADNSDQSPPAGFLEKIKDHTFVQYFWTGKNLGYFGGAREGMKYYFRNKTDYPKWILVTNVDIVFTPDFFHRLVVWNDNQNIGVIAPAIISKKWSADYNPKIPVRYSIRKILFYKFLYSSFILHNLFLILAYFKRWLNGVKKRENSAIENRKGKKGKIYAPHGSCFIFKNTYFILGGTLDLPNFLFGEEIFVGETAARLGLEVIYDPEMIIYDHEHASVGFFVTPAINNYYRESIRAILELYYH